MPCAYLSWDECSAAMRVRACDLASGAPVFGNQDAIAQRSSPETDGVSCTRDGGPCPCIRAGEGSDDRSTPGAAEARILVSSPVTRVETKKAAHRFSAIKMRSLNDPRQARLHPCKPSHR